MRNHWGDLKRLHAPNDVRVIECQRQLARQMVDVFVDLGAECRLWEVPMAVLTRVPRALNVRVPRALNVRVRRGTCCKVPRELEKENNIAFCIISSFLPNVSFKP
ncbi:hypothetical protein L3X38_044892 [Prunus dulcis]|uniref:Uncharacterized protein n=1 Tax=Prunus dulcis TaxID=3755 RepID=A0AAD4V0Z1_PRUDU|nr:hypothetical protein L3X38_044892 [Prunus dulcis]